MSDQLFATAFEQLTGNRPLSWQLRLYFDHFAPDAPKPLPPVIDLPTGLGKTMVMAIWLIARAENEALPRRLIYVVDRRTVVDQATDLATKLKTNAASALSTMEGLTISTLRGQLADNREWSADPSRPAIIIGTVDLIGSALLFSGYRSSFKRRPLEAGLLGQDSLLILDEAHLSKPFDKLLGAIERFNAPDDSQAQPVPPLRVICMSATSSRQTNNVFGLDTDLTSKSFDLWSKIENGKETNPIKQRFEACKRLKILESKDVLTAIVTEAGNIATANPGSRIVIFVNSPKDVQSVRKTLIKKDKSREAKIAQLTGTMRGLERDELVDTEKPLTEDGHERRVMQRFLKPDNDPTLGECFLISTSAGEVGFDLNADHLIGDEAPLDSWIQRLGRVNRRGHSDATVSLVKEEASTAKTDFDEACDNTTRLLAEHLDGKDISPKSLAAFKQAVSAELIERACSPEPATVELTDILLDNWSMTSIIEPMPGRPAVAPWLRGIAEWEPPQTTVAWRAELDLDGFAELELEDIEEWFDTHRILTHEVVTETTSEVATWFTNRWAELSDAQKQAIEKRPVVIDRSGTELIPLAEVIARLSRKSNDADAFLRGAEIVVPVSFGGIRRGVGLLNHEEPMLEDGTPEGSADGIDVADAMDDRFREKIEKPENGDATVTPLDSGATKPKKPLRYSVSLLTDDEITLRLVSYVARREKQEIGSKPQMLHKHVCTVRTVADEILARLSAPKELKLAVQLAADFHDHGKARDRWQRLLVFPKNFTKPEELMGKSGFEMKRDSRGYRHEFGSLREFADEFAAGKLLDSAGKPISQDTFDLAAHLIATHHGRGRPHFPKGGFDPDCEPRSDEIHTDSIRRFARLQRKYGWWRLAWLENLLRCADALASAGIETDDDTDETSDASE